MTEQECLDKMIPPWAHRRGKYLEGVVQIWVTRACDKACFGCTQGSQLAGRPGFITVEQFEQACKSLKGYFGVVGMFGGNPAMHPQFRELCAVMRKQVPANHRGIWSNNPITLENARIMRSTFDPTISNLNVHLDQTAFDTFKQGWPECNPVGLVSDSRHSPTMVAMKDVVVVKGPDKDCKICGGTGIIVDPPLDQQEEQAKNGIRIFLTKRPCCCSGWVPDEPSIWKLISDCDINKHWSAMIGVFRGQLRAWFCEVAGAQAMLHQDEPDYPDTGHFVLTEGSAFDQTEVAWWKQPMKNFAQQVRKHCFDCGVPLRGYGELAQADEVGIEQVSSTHSAVFRPKRKGRLVENVTELTQLETGKLSRITDYLGNARR